MRKVAISTDCLIPGALGSQDIIQRLTGLADGYVPPYPVIEKDFDHFPGRCRR